MNWRASKPAQRAKASAQRTLDFPHELEDARRGIPSESRRINPVAAEVLMNYLSYIIFIGSLDKNICV